MGSPQFRIVFATILLLALGLVMPLHAFAHDLESFGGCHLVDAHGISGAVNTSDAPPCARLVVGEATTCLVNQETPSCCDSRHDSHCHCGSDHDIYVARTIVVLNLAVLNQGVCLDYNVEHTAKIFPALDARCSCRALQSVLSLRGPPTT